MLIGTEVQRKKVMEYHFKLKINETNIELSETSRNLGLIMDHNLNFDAHVNTIRNKSRNKLRSIYRFKTILPPSAKIKICESLILSTLDYCDVVYGPNISVNNANALQKIQNSCARYIYNIKNREHITPSIEKAGWLKMDNRRKVHMLSTVHRVLTSEKPKYLCSKFKTRDEENHRNLRNKNLLTTEKHRTTKYEASFTHQASTMYNKLPASFKTMGKNIFIREVKKNIIERIL
jgi:hypothetical protein